MTERRTRSNRVAHALLAWVPFYSTAIYEALLFRTLHSRIVPSSLGDNLTALLDLDESMADYFFRDPVMSSADEKVLNAFLYEKPIPKPKTSKPHHKSHGATMAAIAFPRFPELPCELQDIIWSMAAADLPPRTIELRKIPLKNPGNLEFHSQYIYRPSPKQPLTLQCVPQHTHTFGSPAPPPTLLSVSHHAREVTKRHYEFAFRPFSSEVLACRPKTVNNPIPACPDCTCCVHGIWVDFSKDIFVAGAGVFGTDQKQREWLDASSTELYGPEVFPEARESIKRIQILAMPIRATWTRNMVTWQLGFLPGVKEIWLVRTRGMDKKPGMDTKGGMVVCDPRPPRGKDEAVFAARTRGFRALGYYMRIREALVLADMLWVGQRLRGVEEGWEGPEGVRVWTAVVRKPKADGKLKERAKRAWDTVSGRRLRHWMGKNYIPPNFG